MSVRLRPIHSSFETLRHSSHRGRRAFGPAATPANEQMAATGFSRINRPVQLFPEFIER